MAIKTFGERLVSLVSTSSTTTIHLVAGYGARGMVFFACEHAPFLTFQCPHGLPVRCPVCGTQNPLKGEQNKSE